ncbi:MAG: winged helix-turn-helix domain-containing protein [Blautia coccoides]
MPRNEIIKALWEQDEFVEDSTLTVNINRIRKKLENMGVTDFLVTRRGHGYQV